MEQAFVKAVPMCTASSWELPNGCTFLLFSQEQRSSVLPLGKAQAMDASWWRMERNIQGHLQLGGLLGP